jgi:hypothetical protein
MLRMCKEAEHSIIMHTVIHIDLRYMLEACFLVICNTILIYILVKHLLSFEALED